MKIDWNYCQLNSEAILAEGLNYLSTSENKIPCYASGNYLILHSGKPYYIGEAEDISRRLKTQFAQKDSTFYKNYLKYCSTLNQEEPLNIEEFQAKFIETNIGRKEMEEFGIVNLPTILNKFQKGKREKREFAEKYDIWDSVQHKSANLFIEAEKLFLNQSLTAWNEADIPASPGVYRVLDADKKLIYIGESSNISTRYITHSNSKNTYFSALRRHIATGKLGLELINKRRLTEENESKVNKYLSQCSIDYMRVPFGRYEFEKFLIKKHSPILNRKDNK